MKHRDNLLVSVSRSFYLSIRFLPKAMRPGIALGYLLARATDTVADALAWTPEYRLTLLEKMKCLLTDTAYNSLRYSCSKDLQNLAENLDHDGEATLLRRFDECLDQLSELSENEQQAVRDVLSTITDGQIWDLKYFQDHKEVVSSGQLENYTYMVAGCVGEFWTNLGFLCLGDRFSMKGKLDLGQLGIHYGMGLQLVNILRDRVEDELRGRVYLPSGGTECWMKQAENYLNEGIRYAETLCLPCLRFSTVLPAYLGLDTLNLLKKNPGVRVKISRRRVYRRMIQAFVFAWTQPN